MRNIHNLKFIVEINKLVIKAEQTIRGVYVCLCDFFSFLINNKLTIIHKS